MQKLSTGDKHQLVPKSWEEKGRNVPPHITARASRAANGIGSFVFIDDMAADRKQQGECCSV